MKGEIKMIFVSSTVPLKEIPTSKEKIYKSDWFLFSTMIKEKDYQKDDGLDGIYYKLCLYPYFYTQDLYNYLMSDNYYYKHPLYATMQNSAQLFCMRRVKRFDEITNWDVEVINELKHIFREKDIKKMFKSFKDNNFKKNPVCEFILKNET